MKESIIGLLVSGIGFLLLAVVLMVALVKSKKGLIAGAALGLVLMLGAGVWSAIRLAQKTHRRAQEIMAPRTGNEIYSALFGEPLAGCVHIHNWQDQAVPVIDFAIYLEGQTCPQEMQRLAGQRTYTIDKAATEKGAPGMDNISWFTPATLGDSIWVWTQFDERGNGRQIYLSPDSTRFFCRDIAN